MKVMRHPELNRMDVSTLGGVVIVLEVEAEPRVFCDAESFRRVLLSLSDEWRDSLEPFFEAYVASHADE